MKTASLYDMTEEWKLLLEDLDLWAEEHGGDVTDYPFVRLDKLEGEVKDKALRIACLFKDLKAREEAIAEEAKSLAARKKSVKNHKDRLKVYLESCLPQNAKWSSPKAELAWKNNPPAVEVLVDVDLLPAKYQVVTWEAKLETLKGDMVEVEIQETDVTGAPVFDTEDKPVMLKVKQVTWPMPTGEKKTVAGDEDGGEPHEVDVLEDRVIARMRQGRSIVIK